MVVLQTRASNKIPSPLSSSNPGEVSANFGSLITLFRQTLCSDESGGRSFFGSCSIRNRTLARLTLLAN
ncbi:hypothetical protein HYQ46_012422 [Verticillium longisporum]|nr:hypothetical protein HYQ46_012422 [Verticillium longisporum]